MHQICVVQISSKSQILRLGGKNDRIKKQNNISKNIKLDKICKCVKLYRKRDVRIMSSKCQATQDNYSFIRNNEIYS